MLKYKVVNIKLNEATTVQRALPAWELPLLQVVHPESSIEVIGETLVKRQAPEAMDEFVRLSQRYHSGKPEGGMPEETSIVAKVYGAFGVGNEGLARAIREAFIPDEAVPTDGSDLAGVPVSSVGG